MGASAERQLLKRHFGKAFGKKVDKMSDSQVIAIYMRLKLQGKLK